MFGQANAATQHLPPAEDFFDHAAFSDAQLSPNGKFLAVRVGVKGQREQLSVIDLASQQVRVVGKFTDADIGDFSWVNDERLLYSAADRSRGVLELRYVPGLYAVNRDGSLFRQLANRGVDDIAVTGTRQVQSWRTVALRQPGDQASDYVYVQQARWDGAANVNHTDLLQLNTMNGHTKYVERPGDTDYWLLDQKGEPRICITYDKAVSSVLYRDPSSGAWRKLVSFSAFTGGAGAFSPLAFGPDGTFYVVNHSRQDTSAVHTFDFATNTMSAKPLVVLEGYDFSGSLIMDQSKLVGIRYLGDTEETLWFDPAMKALQESVDTLLPHTVNLLTLPRRPETPWVLVNAYSDQVPRTAMLYNRQTKTLSEIGGTHPRIHAEQMGKRTLVHYAARDGLAIPAWLTLPPGQDKHLPMVVLVHGGPFIRGASLAWNADAQFLASRGYAVLEPEYRGSTGFGSRHYRAGWKQWGLKMQDDIADGTRWASAQGVADPNRVCIAGANYGGYATLMGLVNDPGLYQCGIDWQGITDLKTISGWGFGADLPEGWKQRSSLALLGDPIKDAAQLSATSPVLQAARVTRPLLLAHGGADTHVPIEQGTRFYDAVKASNHQVEWVEYPEEGYEWNLTRNRVDFWTRVEKFLDRHIGTPKP